MIVMKFGGSSTADLTAIKRVVSIVKNSVDKSPVVIFSAMGKTTRKLLTAAKHVEEGESQAALLILNEIRKHHRSLLNEVCDEVHKKRATTRLEGCLLELDNLFKGLAVLKDLSPKGLDKILSFGEIMATIIMTEALTSEGISVKHLCAKEIILTDDNFGNSSPLFPQCEKEICDRILPLLESGNVVVTEGYIGSTLKGHTTTLGFEGSDFTAAIIAYALRAKAIELWKTVPGVMSADPTKIKHAFPLRVISYHEAEKLTALGASCIHPKAMAPAELLGMPIYIKNSENINDLGTLISFETERGGAKSITELNDLTLFTIRSKRGPLHRPLPLQLFSLIESSSPPPHFVTSISDELMFLVSSKSTEYFETKLSEFFSITWKSKGHLSLISIVGEGSAKSKRLYHHIEKILESPAICHLFEDSNQLSLSILLESDQKDHHLKELHHALFEKSKGERS